MDRRLPPSSLRLRARPPWPPRRFSKTATVHRKRGTRTCMRYLLLLPLPAAGICFSFLSQRERETDDAIPESARPSPTRPPPRARSRGDGVVATPHTCSLAFPRGGGEGEGEPCHAVHAAACQRARSALGETKAWAGPAGGRHWMLCSSAGVRGRPRSTSARGSACWRGRLRCARAGGHVEWVTGEAVRASI